jgi:Flp pilus assembly protein TadB
MSKIDPNLVTASVADNDTLLKTTTETKDKTSSNGPVGLIMTLTALAVILWGLAIAAFGIPGLYIPALIAVPVIFVLLLLISRG